MAGEACPQAVRAGAVTRYPLTGPDSSRRSIAAAAWFLLGARERLDENKALHIRVIEYEVPDYEGDGKGELIARSYSRGMTA
jgi:hypothetical protein